MSSKLLIGVVSKMASCHEYMTPITTWIIRLTAAVLLILVGISSGIVSVQDYCDKFNNYNVKPIICLLRTTNQTDNGHGPGGIEEEWVEEDDDDCSCEVNCFPPFVDSPPLEIMDTFVYQAGEDIGDPQCQPCGTHCPITPFVKPRCRCATLGENTNRARCRCSVTCATNPRDSEEPYCILNVTNVKGLRDPTRVLSCDCAKSKAAQSSPYPDFACLCQPTV